jgi:putative DNA primase/helicase
VTPYSAIGGDLSINQGKTEDTREAARRYLRAGLAAIPVPPGEKNPNRRGWQTERWTLEDVPRVWANGENIGVLTGEPSGWVVDVDLDCPEAVKIAGRFLPPTLTSGRDSVPDSHWWFRCEGLRSRTFEDLGTSERDPDVVLELRSNGRQTVVAPSLHPEGDRYRWSASGLEMVEVEAEDLLHRCRMLATAALVARVLPRRGRHRFGLALAGFLLRRGLETDAVEKIMHAAWDAAGFTGEKAKRDAHRDIAGIVSDTADKLSDREEVVGEPTLDELVPALPRKISRFWGWRATRAERHGDDVAGRNGGTGGEAGPAMGPVHLTDMGNAERFARDHRGRALYCHPWGKWLVWTGSRWRVDDMGLAVSLAKRTVRRIYAEAGRENDDDRRRAVSKWAQTSEAAPRIKAILELARDALAVTPEALDGDPWMLNCENGTLDLRTGVLRDHDPADLITKIAPVRYDPGAEAEAFDAFLDRILPKEEMRSFVRRLVGYSSFGVVREDLLVILHGKGDNGKTTLTDAVRHCLGDYAISVDPEILMARKFEGHSTERMDLFGKRFVSCQETGEGRRLAEARVKAMTSRDPIRGRRMREDSWEFEPSHTTFLSTNHKPEIRGTDHAIWRRLKLVPFDVKIPEAEKDRKLPETLREQMPGILAWIVRGCREYLAGGLGEPEEVRDATAAYRSDMDIVGRFVAERCVVKEGASAKFADLWSEFVRWCEDANEAPGKKPGFGTRLTEQGYESFNGAKNVAMRSGIGLRFDGPDDTETSP